MASDWDLLGRIAIGFVVAYAIGFERELRGSVAGDRTFALVGAASTAIAATVGTASPQALAGIVTGVGFIGAGVVVHSEPGLVRGVTTAAAIYATAGVGLVIGIGHVGLGLATALGVLLILEVRNMRWLRRLDARRYQTHFRDDHAPPA